VFIYFLTDEKMLVALTTFKEIGELMHVISSSQCLKLVTGLILTAALTGCLEQGEEESPSEGNSAISLSGTYKSSCTQVRGAAIANGNYEQTWARYGVGGDATAFEYSHWYFSDNACTGYVYNSIVTGTFAVGSTTSAPANGYSITYTADYSYILWGEQTRAASFRAAVAPMLRGTARTATTTEWDWSPGTSHVPGCLYPLLEEHFITSWC
jgi:hypothetical protein